MQISMRQPTLTFICTLQAMSDASAGSEVWRFGSKIFVWDSSDIWASRDGELMTKGHEMDLINSKLNGA